MGCHALLQGIFPTQGLNPYPLHLLHWQDGSLWLPLASLLYDFWASLMVHLVKNPPAMRETWIRSLGWEDLLEKGKATYSSESGLKNSMDCTAHGVTKRWTRLSNFHSLLYDSHHLGSPTYCVLLLLLSRFSRVRLYAIPQTAAHQAPPSLGFSRQEHWSGLPFPSPMHESEKWKWSRSVVSDSSRPHGLRPTRLLYPWDFPGKSTGVGCHCVLCSKFLVSPPV